MGKHNEFGKQGEQVAVDFLQRERYEICYRNYRYQRAEVDIIARKGAVLAIVEVKSRSVGFLGDLSDTINQKKIKLLVLAADNYVQERKLDVEVRFDIILVIKNKEGFEVEHVKNAFYYF
ncbi:MAG: YraN family protein [Flavobacteriaceae bacterium]